MADPKPIRLTAAKLGPGSVVDGRYKVVRVLGSGGTGVVHEVEHVKTGQKYAMKTLLDAGNAARLEQEARALMRLRTRHAIKVFDLGQNDRIGPYLVMNLLEGQTMRALLDEKQQLDLSTIANLTMQVAECLDEAHSLGLVHRDLKPDNIHLTPIAGGLFEVTVLDFGVVKVQAHDADVGLTRTGSTIGTPYYMSLEQLRGASSVDATSDVYSLSVMLYESLAGVVPYKASNLGDLVYAICSSPAPHLSALRADLPPEIVETIMRGLASKKESRPASMREVANAFLRHAEPTFSLWLRTTTHTRPPEEWANLLTAPLLPSSGDGSSPLGPLEGPATEAPTRIDPVQAGAPISVSPAGASPAGASPGGPPRPAPPRATGLTSQPPPPVRLKQGLGRELAPPPSSVRPMPPPAPSSPGSALGAAARAPVSPLPSTALAPTALAPTAIAPASTASVPTAAPTGAPSTGGVSPTGGPSAESPGDAVDEPVGTGDRETPTEMFVKERHLPEEDLAAFSAAGGVDRGSSPTIAIPPHLAAAGMSDSSDPTSVLAPGETTTVLAIPDELSHVGGATSRLPALSRPSLSGVGQPRLDVGPVRPDANDPAPGSRVVAAKSSVDDFMRQVGSAGNEMALRGLVWFRKASPRVQTTTVVFLAASSSILFVLALWLVIG